VILGEEYDEVLCTALREVFDDLKAEQIGVPGVGGSQEFMQASC